MYKLKQIPSDFIVKEVSSYEFKEKGKYLYFQLKKEGRNTMDVLYELAKIFHVPVKEIGFSGAKDKHAITTQICSVRSFGKITKQFFENISLTNVTLTPLGFLNVPATLGSHDANRFEITVRNLDDNHKVNNLNHFVNYFDEQRFSTNNVAIGRHIVKKEFKKAVELIDDESVQSHIKERQNDLIGALKCVPKRLLMMYAHAYQSYLWNTIVAKYLESKFSDVRLLEYSCGEFVFINQISEEQIQLIQNTTIHIPGFLYDEDTYSSEIMNFVDKVFDVENVDFSDFIIRQIPSLSQEGALRDIITEIVDLNISEVKEDELNDGMRKVTLSFTLKKGCYATMVVRNIISQK